ncbi:MAG: hypothetical protein WCR42_04930 [bacterium]
MKKYFLAINLLAFVILLSSCEDIVDADYKIKKTKISYHSVITNQENGVIMPLKVGNLWVYKITSYNQDGSLSGISYDSLLIKRDTIINNEKWFIIEEPQYKHNDLIYLTNTDIGLWYKSSEMINKSYLRAEYPIKNATYFIETVSDEIPELVNDSLDIWINTGIANNFSSSYGVFNCNKYTAWGHIRKADRDYNPWFVEYYSPNLGLLRTEQYKEDANKVLKLHKISELVYTNLKTDKLFKQSTFEIDFGILKEGESKVYLVNRILENDSQSNLIINSVDIIPDPCFSIVNSPGFPLVIVPNDAFGLILDFTPTFFGDFESEMQIYTNQGTFTVKLTGRCLDIL